MEFNVDFKYAVLSNFREFLPKDWQKVAFEKNNISNSIIEDMVFGLVPCKSTQKTT